MSAIEKEAMRSYFREVFSRMGLDPAISRQATIVLAGSTPLGIKDSLADWDFHVVLPDSQYALFCTQYGGTFVIDDKETAPSVFAVFRPISWLMERFETRNELYYWIYSRAALVVDPGGQCASLIEEAAQTFALQLKNAVKDHYVRYRAIRHGLPNIIHRDMHLASFLVRVDSVRLAMQITSLACDEPYPYDKWLSWHVRSLGPIGREIVDLSQELIAAVDPDEVLRLHSSLRDRVTSVVAKKSGDVDWIREWWKYVIN